jgi:hypothetical protein
VFTGRLFVHPLEQAPGGPSSFRLIGGNFR